MQMFKTGQHLDNIQKMEHNNNIHKELWHNYEKKIPYLHQEWSLILFQLDPFLQKKL